MDKAFIKSLAFDTQTQSIVVILGITDSQKYIPIWINNSEALAIALGKSKIIPPRPMTHDLLISIIDGFGGMLQKIVITGLKDNTYYAMLHIKHNKTVIVVDARPSDSIAIAVRKNTQICIADSVTIIDPEIDIDEDTKLSERLKTISPEDLISM